MDIRILLGIVVIIAAVIVASRFVFFLFDISLGEYNFITPLLIIITVGIVVVLMVKKLIKEQSY